MISFRRLMFLALILLLVSCAGEKAGENQLEEGFIDPETEAGPFVWWHWIDGHISKEGISKDIQAMAEQGIAGATVLNVKLDAGDFEGHTPAYDYMSEDWKRMVAHAFEEAGRYGIELGVHNCDGWSHIAGKWITPQQGMKKVTFSKTVVEGGERIQQQLPAPPGLLDFYRDVSVLAYPYTGSLSNSMYSREYVITSNVETENLERAADGNVTTSANFVLPET